MKYYTVDFSKAKTECDLDNSLKKGLSLPSDYTINLNTLFDFLTSDYKTPVVIYIKGMGRVPILLNDKICTLLDIFEKINLRNDEFHRCINIVLVS